MGMRPIDRMWERVDTARQDSDTALFLALLYCGEMIIKIIGAGLVAAIRDDRERYRYRQAHKLVRSDGIGDWVSAVDDILNGPASQHLMEQAREEQRELTSRNTTDTWQYSSVRSLHACICLLESDYEQLPTRVDGRRWLSLFAMFRNKTRGHGATQTALYSKLCPSLEESIKTFVDNFRLFKRPWAYLSRLQKVL